MGKELELAIKIGGKIDKSLGSAINNAQSQLGGLNGVAGKIAAGMAGVFAAVKIKDFAADAVETYKGYQDSLNNTAAIAGVAEGSANYDKLASAAREAGKATVKTAQESAEALGYMALAGWNVDDSCEALQPVLKLSVATGADLAYTSDLVTDSMANLGLGINDLGRYLDVSIQANNKSNQTATQLQEAYLGVGGVLKNLNVPIEQSAAVLGVLANRGTKGSEAGTALSAILVNMQKKSGESSEAMSKLGVSMYDTHGKARSIIDVFEDINKKTSGMTEQQRNLIYQMIGGKSHLDSFAKIMAGFTDTTADGAVEVYSLIDQLNNCNGALDDFYDVKTGTLTASMEVLKSAMDDMKISLVEQFAPTATDVIQSIADHIPDLTQKVSAFITNLISKGKQGYAFIKEHAGAIKAILTGIVTGVAAFATISKTVSVVNAVSTSVKVLSGAMTKVPANAGKLVTAVFGLKTAFTALLSPAGLAIAALSALAVGFVLYQKHRQEAIDENLAEHFGSISLSAQETGKYVEQIFSNTSLSKVSNMAQEFEKVEDHLKSMSEASAVIHKYNWRSSMGFTLSESEVGDYRSQIDQFVQSAISAVEQQHYALSLSLEVYADNPQLQGEMSGIINSVFGGTEAELTQLGAELGDYVMRALEDGIISADEAACIAAMQEKIASLTEKLSNAQSQAKLDNIALEFDFSSLTADSFQSLQEEIQNWLGEKETSLQSVKLEQLATVNMLTEIPQEALDNGFTGSLEQYKETIRQKVQQTFENEKFQAKVQGIEVYATGIEQAYQQSFGKEVPQIESLVSTLTTNLAQSTGDDISLSVRDILASSFGGFDGETRGAIKQLFDEFKDEISSAEQIKTELATVGMEIPKSVIDGMNNADVIGAISGDKNSKMRLIGAELARQGKTDIIERLKTELGEGELTKNLEMGAVGVEIDTNIEEGNINTEPYQQTVEQNVQQIANQPEQVEQQVDTTVQAGNVDAKPWYTRTADFIKSCFVTEAAAAEIEADATVQPGMVNANPFQVGVHNSILTAAQTQEQTVTANATVQPGNINTEPAKESIFSKIKGLFSSQNTSVNVAINASGNAANVVQKAAELLKSIPKVSNTVLNATDNVTPRANTATSAVNGIPQFHNTQLTVSGNAAATANSIKNAIADLPTSKTVTIDIVTNGTIPHAAKGIRNAPAGTYMVNDQNISDPREVIEHNGTRYYYEGRNVITTLQKGDRVYPAAESRAFIHGSHKSGLERVPFDGYIAELHAGERVLTEDEADGYEENGLFSQAVDRIKTFMGKGTTNHYSQEDRKIVFAPQITVKGGDEHKVQEYLKMSYREFCEFMEEYDRDRKRKSFA
nr:MAG TPA: minor tail protein [Caudoviricetes sp.]